MGRMTTDAIGKLRVDVFITSPTAVTDNTCFNHSLETVDTKQAMFAASAGLLLYVGWHLVAGGWRSLKRT